MPISVKRPLSFPAVVGPLRGIITSTLALADRRPGDIAVVLERDGALRELNRRWRGIDRATDVLSFPYEEGRAERVARDAGRGRGGNRRSLPRIDGDLVISLDRVAAQARRYRVTRGRELARLVIHGMLHLAGHDHHRAGERRAMRSLERRALRNSARAIARLTRLLATAEWFPEPAVSRKGSSP